MSCISQYRYFLGKGNIRIQQHTLSGNFYWVPRKLTWVSCSKPLPPASHTYSTDLRLHSLLTRPHQRCILPWVFIRYGKKLPFSHPPLSLLVLSSKQGCSSMAKCLPSEREDQGYVTPISYKSKGQSLTYLRVPRVPCHMISSFLSVPCWLTIPIVHWLNIGLGVLQIIHILMFMWEHFLEASSLSCMYTNFKSSPHPHICHMLLGQCQRNRGSLRSVQCPSSKWTQCTALQDFLIDFIFQTRFLLSRSSKLPKRMKNKFLVISKQTWVILVIDGLSDV